MPLHLLGKKSWNVYNPANIERVRRDEAEAQARAEAEEERRQAFEAERRLAILRGEVPPAPPSPPTSAASTHRKREHTNDDDDPTARFRGGGEHKKRKRFGEDDTDFEMRVARERAAPANTNTMTRPNKSSDAPLVDSRGHISLFPEEETEKRKGKGNRRGGDAPKNQKNEEAEREAADKRREFEDQYTMRFANAAGREGVGVTGSGPWYASGGASVARELAEQTPGKDAFGRDDPRRRARDAARVVADDPLAMMKRGAAKVRDVERERRALNEEKARELKQLRREEKKKREKRRRQHGDDVDGLEGFSLDAQAEGGERDNGSRESRDRDGREGHRHHRRSDCDDDRERDRHRPHGEHRYESRSHQSRHSEGNREDQERHSSGQSRRRLAKTDHS
ncbi:hypothetical protein F5B17DRAFT_272642 [Nemania serpens]|nr:hypothetical protein F5B17DRAFT_272642 [Nemania serpens]